MWNIIDKTLNMIRGVNNSNRLTRLKLMNVCTITNVMWAKNTITDMTLINNNVNNMTNMMIALIEINMCTTMNMMRNMCTNMNMKLNMINVAITTKMLVMLRKTYQKMMKSLKCEKEK